MNTTSERNNNLRVRGPDSNAAANDSNRIRNILIFDNHPFSPFVRQLYIGSLGSTLSQYYVRIIALLILGLALVVVVFS